MLSQERCFGLAEAGERFWFLRGRVAARRQRRWELSWWGHVSWAQPLRDEGCCIAVDGGEGQEDAWGSRFASATGAGSAAPLQCLRLCLLQVAGVALWAQAGGCYDVERVAPMRSR